MNFNLQNHNIIQGLLLLGAGVLLLLYTFNLVTAGINFLFMLVAIALIIYGTFASGLNKVIENLINKISGKKH